MQTSEYAYPPGIRQNQGLINPEVNSGREVSADREKRLHEAL